MHRFVVSCGSAAAVLATMISAALAGNAVPLGQSLSAPLGTSLPIAGGGLIALVAASVIGGAWLIRRKR